MKIKPPSAKNRRITALKMRAKHWWLIPEKPKSSGRLSQLNKHNRRYPSEFVRMAEHIEYAQANRRR